MRSYQWQKHVAFSNQPEDIIVLVNVWSHMYSVFYAYPSSSTTIMIGLFPSLL
ncbi:hypothetical protein SEVIR_8G263150v4 [Setaria viridis]